MFLSKLKRTFIRGWRGTRGMGTLVYLPSCGLHSRNSALIATRQRRRTGGTNGKKTTDEKEQHI